ncbi:MAG: hypothetical protein J5643_05320 [Lachnospiraceae bacterium]|nr:hypothetical protein [Lachnospiraceae bacterium]
MRKKCVGLWLLVCLMVSCLVLSASAEEPEEPQEKRDFVIDLTSGYYYLKFIRPAEEEGLSGIFEYFTDGQIDLDKDGTPDVAVVDYSPRMYGSSDGVFYPLPGGSVNGEITINGTEADPFRSVTFRVRNADVKNAYKVSVSGGYAYTTEWDENNQKILHKVTSAAPGTHLLLMADTYQGRYVAEWKSDEFHFPPREDQMVKSFIMPAHDVKISAVIKNQTPLTITLRTGDLDNGMPEWSVFDQYNGESSCFYEALGKNAAYDETESYIDLDGDGTYDVYVSPWKSTSALGCTPIHSVPQEYKMPGYTSGPFYPVILKFDTPAYSVDLSKGIIISPYYTKEGMDAVVDTIKSYEMPDKPGYFDIDKNGKPDLRVASDRSVIVVLDTCSLGKSYTIPANGDGIKHSLTFVCPKKPVYHTFTMEVEEGGTAAVYEQETDNYMFTYMWGSLDSRCAYGISSVRTFDNGTIALNIEGTQFPFIPAEGNRFLKNTVLYLNITPDKGYRLKDVLYLKGTPSEEAGTSYVKMNDDISVRVVFEKIPEPTPTPIPTPTPTVKPTEIPTEEPTAVPTEVPSKGGKQTDKTSFKPIYVILPVGACLAAFIACLAVYLKKRKNGSDTTGK